MRVLICPIIVFVLNYVLYESFPSGGGGTGLGFLITWPILILSTIFVSIIYFLRRKSSKKTKYFELFSIVCLILLSYILFITEPDNAPLDVIKRMTKVEKNYADITIGDYFLDYRYNNFEKIVAAKKKFHNVLFDSSYLVKIKARYSDNIISSYAFAFDKGQPIFSEKNVKIQYIKRDTFEFINYLKNDTIIFYATPNYVSDPVGKRDSFMNYGTGYSKDTTLKIMTINEVLKNQSPDNKYWAYAIFYYLL